MEPSTELFSLFGLDIETFAMVTAIVYFVVEAFKRKFATVLLGGLKTDVLALLISFGMAYKIYYPNIESFIACGLLCWLLPAGIHKVRNGGIK